jgi:hypothetical protein
MQDSSRGTLSAPGLTRKIRFTDPLDRQISRSDENVCPAWRRQANLLRGNADAAGELQQLSLTDQGVQQSQIRFRLAMQA